MTLVFMPVAFPFDAIGPLENAVSLRFIILPDPFLHSFLSLTEVKTFAMAFTLYKLPLVVVMVRVGEDPLAMVLVQAPLSLVARPIGIGHNAVAFLSSPVEASFINVTIWVRAHSVAMLLAILPFAIVPLPILEILDAFAVIKTVRIATFVVFPVGIDHAASMPKLISLPEPFI